MRVYRHHSGQMLLITLLVLAVAITIALSLIGRTTTDLNISTQTEESSRAFSAAEAGIEQALRLQTNPPPGALAGGVTFNVTSDIIGGTSGLYMFPNMTANGQTETVWMVDHNATTGLPIFNGPLYTDDTMRVCWGGNGAVEVIVYYIAGVGSNLSALRTSRVAYDSNGSRIGALSESNQFDSTVGGTCGAGTATTFSKTFSFTTDFGVNPAANRLILLRIRPLYNASPTQLAISTATAIPQQGNNFESCGQTGGGIKRCITVYQNYKIPPGVFDFVLYADQGALAPI